MLDITRFSEADNIDILDLGCGYGGLYEYMTTHWNERPKEFRYKGIDISGDMISAAKTANPDIDFEQRDVLTDPLANNRHGFVIMNGLFTEKQSMSFDEMFEFTKAMLKIAYDTCINGIAFNVMSKNVDWEREDLFHLSIDSLAKFLSEHLTRDFVIRSDYKLYEYTCYAIKK
ncbi:class I SAM-dependent methyltransferase [Thalassospira profundimaris]|nr:class I SAM-dependent methyltransferase [Thalassospira profundimaris]